MPNNGAASIFRKHEELVPNVSVLRILAVLPTINHYGGVISTLNLIDELMEMGHHCVLATLSKYARSDLSSRIEPIWLTNWEATGEAFAGWSFDIVIATSWETVNPSIDIASKTGAETVYFVQDYEVDFISTEDVDRRKRAYQTYKAIHTKVVKTEYLQRKLSDNGFDSFCIRPGMNLNIFYPREVKRGDKFRVLAMARPNAPNDQRGFSLLNKAFERLLEQYKDIEVGFFGVDNLAELNLKYSYVDFGRLTPSKLPEAYCWADVYVDASRFHGFGRTGVEAMACGTPCILSDSGGIRSYAVDRENALIIPIDNVDAIVKAVIHLKTDPELYIRLRELGIQTVTEFDDRLAAEEMVKIFRSLLSKSAHSGHRG